MPGAVSSRPSRTTRWAARSRVVQSPHNVGCSGPTSRMVVTSKARSRWATLMESFLSSCAPSKDLDATGADEHAMPGAVVGETCAVLAGHDRPALRGVGAVVEGLDRDVAAIAADPLDLAGRGQPNPVGRKAVDFRCIRERGLAVDFRGVDLAAGLARLRLDEHVTVLRRQRVAGTRTGGGDVLAPKNGYVFIETKS